MKRFSTTYNTHLKHASLWLRFQGYFLNLIGIAFFSHFLMASFTSFLKLGFYRINMISSAKLISRTFDLYPLVFFTCFFSYYFLSYFMTNGRTLADYILNLYSVPNQKTEFDIKTAFLKASAHSIPIGIFGLNPLLGILSFIIFYYPRRKGLLFTDIVSESRRYEFRNEDILDNFLLEVRENQIMLAQDTSQVIEVHPIQEEAQVLEFPTTIADSDDEEQAA